MISCHGDFDGKILDPDYKTESHVQPPEYSLFPLPNDFKSEKDYMLKCQEWEEEVTALSDGISLPLPLSISVRRPVPHFIPIRKGFKFRINYQQNPPFPSANLLMHEAMVLGHDFKNISIQSTFDNQSVPMSAYIQEKKHWGSELFLQEPNPLYYDTYEEYLEAMSNWKSNLETRKQFLIHPREIGGCVEIPANRPNPIEQSTNSQLPRTPNNNVFDPDKYKDADPLTIPSDKHLQTLFIDINTIILAPPRKQPSQKPLIESLNRIKVEKQHIIQRFTDNFESIDNKDMIFSFYRSAIRYSRNEFSHINRIGPELSNVNDISFLSDLSPSQFKALINFQANTNTPLLFKLLQEFNTLIHQWNYQDIRIISRIYVFLEEIMLVRPEAILSLFFSDVESVSFSTYVICTFSENQYSCQPYYKSKEENPIFEKLTYIAFSLQFIEVLSREFGSNNKVNEQIKAYKNAFNFEKSLIFENNSQEIFMSYNKSITKESLDLHTSVFIILSLNDAKLFIKHIHNKFHPFYLFIGKLKLYNSFAFSRISSFLLYHTNISRIIVEDYFSSPNAISTDEYIIELNSFPLLSLLIDFQVSRLKVNYTDCQTAMFHLMQYVPMKSTLIISLLSSICKVIVFKSRKKDKGFIEHFPIFKQSILTMFYTPNINDDLKSKLLRAVCSLFSIYVKNDSEDFMNRFLPILFNMMLSDNDSLLNSSWTIFREWVLWDQNLYKFIDKNKQMQIQLKKVMDHMNVMKTAKIQYILLLNGFSLFEKHNIKTNFGNENFAKLINPYNINDKDAQKELKKILLNHKFSWLNNERKIWIRQLSASSHKNWN